MYCDTIYATLPATVDVDVVVAAAAAGVVSVVDAGCNFGCLFMKYSGTMPRMQPIVMPKARP